VIHSVLSFYLIRHLLEQKAEPDHLQGIQQVVQQTSRLNQTVSSVIGGGTSTGANVSFGGFYYGF
jgi:hypothetical protein